VKHGLNPAKLLHGYTRGQFPMGDERGRIHWLSPDPRAVIELDAFRVPHSLRSVLRRGMFEVTFDSAFIPVICACADRPEGTWITEDICEAYYALHLMGFAHSVETWYDRELAGGLYGVCIGGAFFGESMFYRVSNGSKVALAALVERLRRQGFGLLDVQFRTAHLERFGAVEIPRDEYLRRLERALELKATFFAADEPRDPPVEYVGRPEDS